MKFQGAEVKPLDKQVSKEPSLLPKIPFTIQLTGQKGSGKSSTLMNLLMNPDMLKGKFHRIYFISPTAKLDEKINVLKETAGIILINKPLIKAINKNKKNKNKILDSDNFEKHNYNTKLNEDNLFKEF